MLKRPRKQEKSAEFGWDPGWDNKGTVDSKAYRETWRWVSFGERCQVQVRQLICWCVSTWRHILKVVSSVHQTTSQQLAATDSEDLRLESLHFYLPAINWPRLRQTQSHLVRSVITPESSSSSVQQSESASPPLNNWTAVHSLQRQASALSFRNL